MLRKIVLVAVALLMLAGLGVKLGFRAADQQRVRDVTGIVWPSGSEILATTSDSSFHSDHTEVHVRIPQDAVARFLATHPSLVVGGCKGNAAAAFWAGPAPERAACADGVTEGDDLSIDWRVTFDLTTRELVERVDAFY